MDIKKGDNILTKAIEQILEDYGGTIYKKVSLFTLKDDIIHRLDEVIKLEKGTNVLLISRLKSKIKKAKDKETVFTELAELLFKFSTNVIED